tara:strand:+ start:135 stop:389 length:255 start_codon:yes stop_codon:yes gene_type:complete
MKKGNITQNIQDISVEDTMTSRDVCAFLKVGIDALNKYCSAGLITFQKPNGGNRLFLKKDVINYIMDKNHRFPSKADIERETTQ